MNNNNDKKLDQLLEKELAAVRRTCDRLGEGGRARLAEFLCIRPSEVSRYLASDARRRKPGGLILSGMQQFVKQHSEKRRPGAVKLLRPIWGHKRGTRGRIDANGLLRLKGSPPMTVYYKDEGTLFAPIKKGAA